jgi:mono/diheme cytochrome c family protein
MTARLGFVAALAAALFLGADAPVDFHREIRPILSDNCFTCHGPDGQQRMAGLRLDTREGAFAERPGYRILAPGDPAQSRLYQRISATGATRMPPPGHPKSLTVAQIALIRRWIEQGAAWKTHWSFTAPVRPAEPRVRGRAWPRNSIDSFVLARLEAEGLKPSAEADRATLIRRLSLDLTGLPPSPAEVDAFLKDRAPDAYERLVERLLASPHHGERLAMEWLDLARYADTHGYHIDSHRDMFHWRDWVVRAFNANMPYDRFTIEQIAGDLLPSPTREQLLATGFNRNHMINYEGGAIAEEYLVEYVVDRVETTSMVWLGLTMGCSRCHDHKYDPISQKDFYRFFAFFNTIQEKGLDGRTGNAEPLLALSTPEQKSVLAEIESSIAARQKQMPAAEIAALQADWEKTRAATLPLEPREGLIAHWEFDDHLSDTSGAYRHARLVRGEATYGEGMIGRAATLSGETHVGFGDAASWDRADRFSIAFWARWSTNKEVLLLQKIDAGAARQGWEIESDEFAPLPDLKRGSRLVARFIHRWPDSAIQVRTRERFFLNEWHHIVVTHDGSGRAAGVGVYLDGKPQELEILQDSLAGSFRSAAPLEAGNKALGNAYKGALDDLRLYGRVLAPEEIGVLAVHHPIRSLLLSGSPRRSNAQRDRLRDYFLTRDAPEKYRILHAELNRLQREKAELEKSIPTSMVMREMTAGRETYVLGRGDYRNRTEKVTPGAPSVLPPLAPDAPLNRLGLARWLVDPSNPLTARVAVNRLWQMYFGTGLVKTAEDFGSQGEPPSHPELLDWLATEFVRTGWDVRAMERLIVLSATYRQSSRAAEDLVARDPENRLLARGPRFRLPAEIVRDNALAASGLLNREMGGPGVYPYQPKNVWEDIAYGDVYSAQRYPPSRGADLYRRSMYTFWKRTAPPPSLAAFDAPDREKCLARRARTNTPLQALVLMNDPTYVEAARALAARAIKEAGADESRRIAVAFRNIVARPPSARETRLLRDLARAQLAEYRRNPAAARALLEVGESRPEAGVSAAELAAWTMVASTILSMDEAITKE